MTDLNTFVHLVDGDGVPHVFGPGSEIPDWAREAITNPDVWCDDEPAEESDDVSEEDDEPAEEKPVRGRGKSAAKSSD